MALLNFSAPFAHAAASSSPFLGAASASAIGGLNTAAAVNTLIYGPQRPSFVSPPPPPPAPSRRPQGGGSRSSIPRPPPPIPASAAAQQNQQQQRFFGDRSGSEPPNRPSGYTRIEQPSDLASQQTAKTSLHAVLDYDDDFDDYSYEDDDAPPPLPPNYRRTALPAVTPIQGPIFLKNGSVPVVPLYSYPVVNNGTLVQIPILWTALSVALGLEIRGEIIRGVPCIKRHHQLFCPTAGNSYPLERIEKFIDDNKALMRRMYGEFQMEDEEEDQQQQTERPYGPAPDLYPDPSTTHDSYFGKLRRPRQAGRNTAGINFKPTNESTTGRKDACDSKIEIVTPYWASNSAGKVRAVVNTQHFEQAIHQEVCSKAQTKRCSGECGCEQKYKWHRLLAYDPDNDCKGIFMDWFLFPSCCVCRCDPLEKK